MLLILQILHTLILTLSLPTHAINFFRVHHENGTLLSDKVRNISRNGVDSTKFVLNFEGGMTCFMMFYNQQFDQFADYFPYDANLCNKSKFVCKYICYRG